MRFLLIFLLAGCCQAKPHTEYYITTDTIVFCANADLIFAKEAVRKEVESRFDRALIYMCHGVPVNGKWMIKPDRDKYILAQDKANELKRRFPDRPIIMYSCNENGLHLKGKGIWYFRKKVWSVPFKQQPYRWYYINTEGQPVYINWDQDEKAKGLSIQDAAKGIEEAVEGD